MPYKKTCVMKCDALLNLFEKSMNISLLCEKKKYFSVSVVLSLCTLGEKIEMQNPWLVYVMGTGPSNSWSHYWTIQDIDLFITFVCKGEAGSVCLQL